MMGFNDFPMQYPVGRSYASSDEVLSYLNLFAEHFDLIKLIRYCNQVILVRPLSDDNDNKSKWEVNSM